VFNDAADYFAVEIVGYFYTQSYSGTFTFSTSSDDESFLWITRAGIETLIVNNGGLHDVQKRTGTVSLNANTLYPIRVRMSENAGGNSLSVTFQATGLSERSDGNGFYYSCSNCSLCAQGGYSDFKGVTTCTSCSTGYGTVSLISTTCDLCTAGTFDDLGACTACPQGTYNELDGQTVCLSCPANRTSRINTITPVGCVCKEGFVDVSGECVECPATQYCPVALQ